MRFIIMPFPQYISSTVAVGRAKVSLVALAVALGASALEVDCTPGTLGSSIETPGTVSELRLNGAVNAADLFFIDSEMPQLRSLDLSQVNISAYSGDLLRRRTSYPESTIPANTFAGKAITTLRLPQGAVTIEGGAFAGTALTTLTVPAGVTFSGYGAFSGCDMLSGVTIQTGNGGDYTFAGCKRLAEVTFTGTATVGKGEFDNCTALTRVDGSAGLISIGESAFDGCSALGSFDFGATLTLIGDRAFAGTALTDANLNGCTKLQGIGAWAFAKCPALTTVQLPATLGAIGKGAFFDCNNLTAINFPVATMDAYVLKDAPLSQSGDILAGGVSTIGDYALMGASGITDLTISNSVDSIGTGAMENMTGLANINAKALDHVPALGEDVWKGVDQRAVTLHIVPDVASEFTAAPQWQDFHIEVMSTNAPIVDVDATKVQGRFDRAILRLRSHGVEMTSVSLYDTAGTRLVTAGVASDEAEIDTSAYTANIYIIVVELADGKRAILKMLR